MIHTSQWWSNETESDIVSGPRLIKAWEELLFGKAPLNTKAVQSLGDLTQELWKKFNTNRAELDRDYMSDEKLLSAYFASFFIPNIERTRSILMSGRIQSHLKKIAAKDTISILDFGSGPLSATFGFLLALGELRKTHGGGQLKNLNLHVTAAERSEKAIKRGESLLRSVLSATAGIEVTRTTSIPKSRMFDVILAANVFNEIPDRHRMSTLNQMFANLSDSEGNLVLIIEPGQFEHSKNLSLLRDQALASTAPSLMKLLAPCPHAGLCPLSPRFSRTDWCWFKSEFSPPEALKQLDAKSQIQHSSLAYSYLAWTKELSMKPIPSNQTNDLWAVCVSDEMPVGEFADSEKRLGYYQKNLSELSPPTNPAILEGLSRSGQKTKLCCKSEEYLAGLRLRGENENEFLRGTELHSLESFAAIIRER